MSDYIATAEVTGQKASRVELDTLWVIAMFSLPAFRDADDS
jgi:hypothetical protein